MASIKPFAVSVPDSSLERLSQKLSLANLPDELEEAEWDYGAPLADIKRLTKYWQEKYDWRKAEAQINELPNFKTPIEVDGFGSLDIHFVHQKSPVEGAIPLLFAHGCKCPLKNPTSMRQFSDSHLLQGPAPSLKCKRFFPSSHPPSLPPST